MFHEPNPDIVPPARRRINLADFAVETTFAALDESDLVNFLQEFIDRGDSVLAAESLGRSEVEFQAVRSTNEAFAKAWAYAEKVSISNVIAEVRRRAVVGVTKEIWYKGDVVGTVREYSDSLLALMAKALHPAYGGVDVAQGAPVPTVININQIPSGHYVPSSEGYDDQSASDS